MFDYRMLSRHRRRNAVLLQGMAALVAGLVLFTPKIEPINLPELGAWMALVGAQTGSGES